MFSRLRDSLSKSRRALTEQIQVAAFDPEDDASAVLAPTFAEFLRGLVDCRPYDEARERALEEHRRRSQPG